MRNTSKELAIQQRREQALALRIQGLGYRQIGEALGVSRHTAYTDVSEALADIPKANAEELRRLELARLEEAQRVLDEIIRDPNSSRAEVRKTVETMVRVSERRSNLLGLNAPTRSMSWIHQEIDLPDRSTSEALLSSADGALLAAQVEAFVSGVDMDLSRTDGDDDG